MGYRRNAIAVAVVVAGLSPAAALAAIKPGKYCARDAITTPSGDELGVMASDAVIKAAGAGLTLSFSNTMPDSGQSLELGTVDLQPAANGAFRFRFTDNWGAKGVGVLKPTRRGISVDLTRTGKASDDGGANAGRNYGRADLKRAPCRRAD